MKCLICDLGCIDPKLVVTEDSVVIDCRRCGNYQVEGIMLRRSQNNSQKLGGENSHVLSAIVRRSYDYNRLPLKIRGDTLEYIFAGNPMPQGVIEKSRQLLDRIAQSANHYGEKVKIHMEHDISIGFCKDRNEFQYFLTYLSSRKFISFTATDKADNPHNRLCSLTVEGYAYLEEHKEATLESRTVFIAMSFNENHRDIFLNALSPAIKKCGYEPFRLDYHEHNGLIDDIMIAEIRKCRFMIADFSDHRPNVYFEAGYARGLGKPVILTCNDEDFKTPHFDTSHYNHIVYKKDNLEDLEKDLIARIEATII